jgi:hypothetical protein
MFGRPAFYEDLSGSLGENGMHCVGRYHADCFENLVFKAHGVLPTV